MEVKEVLIDVLILKLNWKYINKFKCDGCDYEQMVQFDLIVHDDLLHYKKGNNSFKEFGVSGTIYCE